jgi:hypothetical protein
MNLSRLILLGVTALGLQVGRAAAADPVPAKGPPVLPAAEAAPPADTPAAAAGACTPALPCMADACCPCGCPESGGKILAGVGLYLMEPFFTSNPAYTVLVENQNPPRGTPTFHILDHVDIRQHMELAPLMWLGYMDESGLGARARYWYFREGTQQALAFPASTGPALVTVFSATPLGLEAFGDTLFSPIQGLPGTPEPTAVAITSKLELQVADLEACQDVQTGCWDFLFSGGVRLASLDQAYNFYNLQPTTVPLVERFLVSSYNFQGIGPVLAVESRRPLGDSGLALVGNLRGAALFGTADQRVLFGGTTLRNDDPNPQTALEKRNRGLLVGELEVGLEYGQVLGRSRIFGQINLVGQDWPGAGSASRSAQHLVQEGQPAIGGTAVDSDLSFFGLSIRLGVNY